MFRAVLIALSVAFAVPAAAQQSEIEGVIADQLPAFNDRDVAKAWEHASPMIQGMFGTPDNFGMMVERGYPMVWTNSDTRFLELEEMGGRLYQKVMIRGPRGALHVLVYEMIETEAGWQINGVSILPAPDLAA